jgi:hypothetical protein
MPRARGCRDEDDDELSRSYAPLFFGNLFANPPCFCKGWKVVIFKYYEIGEAGRTIFLHMDRLKHEPAIEYDKLAELLLLQQEIGKFFSLNYCKKRGVNCKEALEDMAVLSGNVRKELDDLVSSMSLV